MLINSVIQKEAQRNSEMIKQYENLINTLPKGSLICRRNEYYYLKYREGEKVHDKYIGHDPNVVAEFREKLSLRCHYMDMLTALRKEQKSIRKILEKLA